MYRLRSTVPDLGYNARWERLGAAKNWQPAQRRIRHVVRKKVMMSVAHDEYCRQLEMDLPLDDSQVGARRGRAHNSKWLRAHLWITRQGDISRDWNKRATALAEQFRDGNVDWSCRTSHTLWTIHTHILKTANISDFHAILGSPERVKDLLRAIKDKIRMNPKGAWMVNAIRRTKSDMKPSLTIPYVHTTFGRWPKMMRQMMKARLNLLTADVRDMMTNCSIYHSYDRQLSSDVLNVSKVIREIDFQAYETAESQKQNPNDQNWYLQNMKQKHCWCCAVDPKFYGNKKEHEHISTLDTDILNEITEVLNAREGTDSESKFSPELQELLQRGTKYRKDVANPTFTGNQYESVLLEHMLHQALERTEEMCLQCTDPKTGAADSIERYFMTLKDDVSERVNNIAQRVTVSESDKETIQKETNERFQDREANKAPTFYEGYKTDLERLHACIAVSLADKVSGAACFDCKYSIIAEVCKEYSRVDDQTQQPYYERVNERKPDILKRQLETTERLGHMLKFETNENGERVPKVPNKLPHVTTTTKVLKEKFALRHIASAKNVQMTKVNKWTNSSTESKQIRQRYGTKCRQNLE